MQLLSVSLAVVVHAEQVLLVCRRDNTEGVFWGWPTGVIKPGRDPEHVAVTETLAETGVHCVVRSALGTRIHPMTGALCAYFLCDHLAGEPENRDQVENTGSRPKGCCPTCSSQLPITCAQHCPHEIADRNRR